MKVNVYGYKKCSTVAKANKFLEKQGFDIEFFDFVAEQISRDTIVELVKTSGVVIDEFFNKKGQVFKSLGLKVLLGKITVDEKLNLLLSNGMLIKRPIIKINDKVFIGFNEKEITKYLDSIK